VKKLSALAVALVSLLWLTGATWLPLFVASAIDPATTAWVNQVVTNGGTVSGGRQTIVNTFIVCLKTNSLFTTFDRYWLLAGENTQSALTDMVGLVSATNSGATFTASTGYAGNGSTTFVNTNFVPSTNGVNYTQNSASFGGQVQTNRTSAGNQSEYGAGNSAFTQVAGLLTLEGGGSSLIFINGGNRTIATSTSSRGSWIAVIATSSSGALYFNGSSGAAPGGPWSGLSAQGLPNASFYVGGTNQSGTGLVSPTSDQVSSFFVAAGWSSTQAANFETCQNAMMTSIGINVH
jgi:hypothetical protein